MLPQRPKWLDEALKNPSNPKFLQEQYQQELAQYNRACEEWIKDYLARSHYWQNVLTLVKPVFKELKIYNNYVREIPVDGQILKLNPPITGRASHDQQPHRQPVLVMIEKIKKWDKDETEVYYPGYQLQGRLIGDLWVTITLNLCLSSKEEIDTQIFLENNRKATERHAAELINPKNAKVLESWLRQHLSGLITGAYPVRPNLFQRIAINEDGRNLLELLRD